MSKPDDEGDETGPTGDRLEWTTDRLALVELLGALNADLAELYTRAVDAAFRHPLLRSRLMIAGHCLRELCGALPRVLGDPVPSRSDVNRPARHLYQAWVADALGFVDDSDGRPRTLSSNVYRAAQAVASAAAAGRQNSRELTAIMATGQVGNVDAAPMRRLHDAIEFFRKWTHGHDYSSPDEPLPTSDQVRTELQIIEQALLTRLGNMADRARAVRELVRRANRPGAERQ